MLISEKFVFTALHPEPQTAADKLVAGLVGGSKPDKAITAAAGLVELGKPVVVLMHDPRAWYLALWRQGCAQKGPLFKRLTDPEQWQQLRAKLQRRGGGGGDMGDARGGADDDAVEGGASRGVPAAWSAEHALKSWYADEQDPAAFREWLVAVLGTRPLRSMISPGFQRSPVSRGCGLMSYEYLKLFINNPNDLGMPPSSAAGLKALDASRGIVAHGVRAEAIVQDMTATLAELGVAVGEKEKALFAAYPREMAARRMEWKKFFDAESMKLLFQRERFIAQRFGYRQRAAAPAEGGDAQAGDAAAGAAPGGAPAKKASGPESKAARQAKFDAAKAAREQRQKEKRAAAEPARSTRPRLADFDDDDE